MALLSGNDIWLSWAIGNVDSPPSTAVPKPNQCHKIHCINISLSLQDMLYFICIESDKENTHITSSAPASSEDEAPLSKNLTRKKTKKVKIDRRVKASRVKRSQADSGSSDEETVNNEANMSDGDGAKKGEDLSNAPKYG